MTEPIPTTAPTTTARGPSARQLIILVVILGAGITFTALNSDVSRISEPGVRLSDGQPFLPEKAGSWTGGEMTGLTADERAILPSDTEGARRIYKDTDGRELYCSLVLAGRDVTSIHRPELCLRGQGWEWGGVTVEDVAAGGATLKVSRLDATHAVTTKDGRTGRAQSIFVYWFVGKDRTTPYHWQRIMWTTMDRVFHNRNHRWAYFLINAPVATSQQDTMKVIAQFIHDLYPELVVNADVAQR